MEDLHLMKNTSKKRRTRNEDDDMLPEYDFSGGVRRKYARRFAKGSIVVVLDPDVAKTFPTAESVDRALRAYCEIIRAASRKKKTPSRRRHP